MKRICLLLCALALAPTAGRAQSLDDVTFTGVKIGASVDYRWQEGDYALPRIASMLDEKRGVIGYRGHVGYDVQLGNVLVIGGEGGIGRGGGTLKAASTVGDYALKPRWAWDISGRIGVLPVPRVLLYGRTGYGWLRTREATDFRATNLADVNSSSTKSGFLWGGGAEVALLPGVFTRAEYNRVNYGRGLTSSKVQIGMSIGF